MNAYTTKGKARIQDLDIAIAPRTQGFRAGAFLAALERQRGWQADAELDWLLTQHGRESHPAAPSISVLKQTIGAALIRVGQRLAGTSREGISSEAVLAVEIFGMTP